MQLPVLFYNCGVLPRLLWRKAVSVKNTVRSLDRWELWKYGAFITVGFWMLSGLYLVFLRLLAYLGTIPMIGDLLLWKLAAIALMTTFGMVVISSLITSLTTLFYAFDLPFLVKAPIPLRTVFIDKSLETAFFSSWMIGLVLFPFMLALGQTKGSPLSFYLAFVALLLPFLLLAAVFGMAFTLGLMYLFPSPRTRDVIWVLSSFSIAIVYVLLRISQPEKLVHPDAMQMVAQYLGYLQAPTARYLPSWWLTVALRSVMGGVWAKFWEASALLIGSAAVAYALLLELARRIYGASYSGAQEGRRALRPIDVRRTREAALAGRLGVPIALAATYWKDRSSFFRDVAHWSQMVLVFALICVYLFSIQHLPLDQADLKSLVSFLNLGIAGFVLASLGLRFTFPSISSEGKSFWVLRAAPMTSDSILWGKFLFSLVPMLGVSCVLIAASNHLLEADRFVSWLSFGTMVLMTITICGMGVGFGALFPRFDFANIHQVESSAGGFVYMAASLIYIAATVAIEAVPVQMHFYARFGKPEAWSSLIAGACAAGLLVINAVAFAVPWLMGRRNLEAYEI